MFCLNGYIDQRIHHLAHEVFLLLAWHHISKRIMEKLLATTWDYMVM